MSANVSQKHLNTLLKSHASLSYIQGHWLLNLVLIITLEKFQIQFSDLQMFIEKANNHLESLESFVTFS